MTIQYTNARRLKMLKQIFLILIVSLTVNFVSTVVVYAKPADAGEAEIEATGQASEVYYSYYYRLTGAKRSTFEFACSANGWNPEWNVLSIIRDIGTVGTYQTESGEIVESDLISPKFVNFLRSTYRAVQVVGLAYLILYFFLSVMDKVMMEQFGFEQLLKKLVLLFVCMLVIVNGEMIFAKILDFGNAILNDMLAFAQTKGVDIDGMSKLYHDLYEESGFGLAVLMLQIVMDALASYIVQLIYIAVIYITFIGRGLEMGVRYMFAPIGIAPLVHDGMRSSGARYIKRFVALAMQGAVALAVVFLSLRLGSMGAGILLKILLPFVTVATLFKVKEYANDIVGAN